MSNTKHLADMLKVCSILPALAIMPAMAGTGIIDTDAGGIFEYSTDSDLYTVISDGSVGSFSGYDASDRFEASVIFVGKGKRLSVADGSIIQDNKAQIGGALAITSNAAGATLQIGKDVKFLNNIALFDGGAIGNYGNTIVADGVLFQGNKAQLAPESNENQIGGGAISLGSSSKTTMLNTNFIANESGYNGGAIATRLAKRTDGGFNDNSSAILKIVGGEFEGNKANGYMDASGKLVAGNGGAIYNTFYSDVTIDGTHFEGNKAAKYGGAIYNDGTADLKGKGGVMTINGGEFEDNVASSGGAIYNTGTLTIKNSEFDENRIVGGFGDGGAIYSNIGSLTVVDSKFEGNCATENAVDDYGYGGAIFVQGGTVDIQGGVFSENTALTAGAMYVSRHTTDTNIDGVRFENNWASDIGALGIFAKNTTLTNLVFTGNYTTGKFADYNDGGAALFLGAETQAVLDNSVFKDNKSASVGGAIATRSPNKGNNSGAKLDITNSVFAGNVAETKGGALYSAFYNSESAIDHVYVSDTSFVGNKANEGGAIYNEGMADRGNNLAAINLDGVTFTGNYASGFGGAIYNGEGGTVALSGTNVFADNTQSGIANDIYNLGVLNIKSGTTTLDGGIAGNGSLTIAEGAILNIGTAAIEQANVILDGTLIATVREGDAQLNIADMFDGKGSIKLALTSEGTYHVFGGQVFDSVDVSSAVYDLSWSEDSKNLIAVMKSVDDIAVSNGLTGNAAQMIANVSNSTSEALNNLGVKIQEVLATGDAKSVEVANKAINPEKTSVVQSTAVSVQNTVSTLAANRMSTVANVGRSGGDAAMTSGGVWAQGLYNKTKLNGEFNGYTRGVAVGVDGTINDDIMVGAGYAFNNSDISSVSRDMDVDTHSVFVYGQYKPAAWYVNAMLNYTMSDYTEAADVLGIALGSDYETDAFGGQITAGYDFDGGITPEFGVRYLHINSTDYTNSVDVKNELDSADYLTVVLGTKYGVDFETNNGLKLRPEIRYAVKYDMISDKSSMTVAMPGVAAYTLSGERLSRVGGEFGIGLTMKYNELDLSLSYDIEVREDYTSQTGMIKARYNF